MKPRVLQAGRFLPPTEAILDAEFDLHPFWREADTAAFLPKQGGEFVGLATSGMVGADAALMAALPSLKVIASRGVGFDKVDLDAAKRQGIVVSNTPGVLTDCVADLAFTMVQARSATRSEEHTSELQSLTNLVCRLLLEKKKISNTTSIPAAAHYATS